eukprot:5736312-Pleurochrysis_carterae.AAC.1
MHAHAHAHAHARTQATATLWCNRYYTNDAPSRVLNQAHTYAHALVKASQEKGGDRGLKGLKGRQERRQEEAKKNKGRKKAGEPTGREGKSEGRKGANAERVDGLGCESESTRMEESE